MFRFLSQTLSNFLGGLAFGSSIVIVFRNQIDNFLDRFAVEEDDEKHYAYQWNEDEL